MANTLALLMFADVNVEAFLSGEDRVLPEEVRKDVRLQQAIANALAGRIAEQHHALVERGIDARSDAPERDEWYRWIDNAIVLMMNGMQTEVTIKTLRDMLCARMLPMDGRRVPSFPSFVKKYQTVLMDG